MLISCHTRRGFLLAAILLIAASGCSSTNSTIALPKASVAALSATTARTLADIVPDGTIHFAGHTWQVKSSTDKVGPGPNIFSASGPVLDRDHHLHLRITSTNGIWSCSEVVLDHTLGYGTYEWTIQGSVAQLDSNVVLGLFTYDDSPTAANNRELDIEVSRWSVPSEPTNAQFVVQPYSNPGNLLRFTIPPDSVRLGYSWSSGKVTFFAVSADGAPIRTWTTTSTDVPVHGNERVHMNLWLFRGNAPTDAAPVDVTITHFHFTPAPES